MKKEIILIAKCMKEENKSERVAFQCDRIIELCKKKKVMEDTETLTIKFHNTKYKFVEIIVVHDQTGSSYNMILSKSAYDQLKNIIKL
jgi:hypothetical protein